MIERPFSLAPFLLLCLIGSAAFFSSYLRMPVLPLYAAKLGAGPAGVGVINGSLMLTAGLLSIPAGLLADKLGRKLPVLAGMAAIAISSLLIPLCCSAQQMAAAYVLFGAGLAAFAPGMMSLVADVVPTNRLGQAYGWYTTAIYTAMTVGPATGGFLANVFGLREVFIISGGLSIAVALLAMLILPGDTRPRRKMEIHAMLGGTAALLHNRWLTACLAASAGSCIAFGVFLTFIPLYGASSGLNPAQVGIVFAAQALTNVLCRVPIGSFADRIDRRWIVAAGLFLIAAAFMAFGQVSHLYTMVACAILMGFGMALNFTAIGALIAEKVPAAQRGLAMGMYNSCIYLGMMAGATAMGIVLKRIGYPLGFAAAGCAALVALVLFIQMLRGSSKYKVT